MATVSKHTVASARRFIETSALPEADKKEFLQQLQNLPDSAPNPDVIVEKAAQKIKGPSYSTKKQFRIDPA